MEQNKIVSEEMELLNFNAGWEVAEFEKVSVGQFKEDMRRLYPKHEFDDEYLEIMWRNIELPRRKTHGSAGYDFFAPFSFDIMPGSWIWIPTGIRAVFKEDTNAALVCFAKSGHGTATGIRPANLLPLIDSDYHKAPNEGHILIKLMYPANPANESHAFKWGEPLDVDNIQYHFEEGKSFMQGVFLPYGITTSDANDIKEKRVGGFGSTN